MKNDPKAARRVGIPDPKTESPWPGFESESMFREIIETCSDALIVIDGSGIVIYVNRAAVALLQAPASRLTGSPLSITLPAAGQGEAEISPAPDIRIIVEYRCGSISVDGREATILMLRDVTDRRLRQTARIVEELTLHQTGKWQSLENLAGGIAHQFNNLMMIVLGQCAGLKRDGTLDRARQNRISVIEESSMRAIEITNHLLAFAGLGRYEFKEIDLTAVIMGIKYIFEIMSFNKARIEYNLDPKIPKIKGDEAQLQRMLYEIVANAVEAVCRPRGIISVTTGATSLTPVVAGGSLSESDLPHGEYVYIQIADNGCGMDEVVESQIFQPLYSTRASAKGLGLSAALGIARTHRGTISVHTIPGHGTTIEIFLPVAGTIEIQEEDPIKMAETIIDGSGGRILIAEDETYMRDLLQEALELSGYRVTASNDGRDCIAKFDELRHDFDCIILDMMMPNLDGRETLGEIRKRSLNIPVIITSGFTRQVTIDEFRSAGVKFLQKPYKLGDLISLVSEVLAR